MKELLQKLESIPWADNKVKPVREILEKHEDIKELWLPKIKYLTELKTETKQEINKWDWMYDKITNAILIYYCYIPWLGIFNIFDKNNNLIGEFRLRLPISVDPWSFETQNDYDLIGTEGEKIKIHTVKGLELTRGEWKRNELTYKNYD